MQPIVDICFQFKFDVSFSDSNFVCECVCGVVLCSKVGV